MKVMQILQKCYKNLIYKTVAQIFKLKLITVNHWLFRVGIQSKKVLNEFLQKPLAEMVQLEELWTIIRCKHHKHGFVQAFPNPQDVCYYSSKN